MHSLSACAGQAGQPAYLSRLPPMPVEPLACCSARTLVDCSPLWGISTLVGNLLRRGRRSLICA